MKLRTTVRLLCSVALACAPLLSACAPVASEPAGTPAPELSIESWLNPLVEGEPVTLAGLKGRPVVVEFWATWCGPCRRSTPHLVELWKEHADDGLVIAGIHSPRGANDTRKVEAFLEGYGIEYPIGLDVSGATSRAFGISSIPHAIIIDGRGNLRWRGNPLNPGFDVALQQVLDGHESG